MAGTERRNNHFPPDICYIATASLHCVGLPRLRIKSTLSFISLLLHSSLWFKSTYHPAWNVHFEGRSFNSLSLKTRQTQKEKENRSVLAVSRGDGRDPQVTGTAPHPPHSPRTGIISEYPGPVFLRCEQMCGCGSWGQPQGSWGLSWHRWPWQC